MKVKIFEIDSSTYIQIQIKCLAESMCSMILRDNFALQYWFWQFLIVSVLSECEQHFWSLLITKWTSFNCRFNKRLFCLLYQKRSASVDNNSTDAYSPYFRMDIISVLMTNSFIYTIPLRNLYINSKIVINFAIPRMNKTIISTKHQFSLNKCHAMQPVHWNRLKPIAVNLVYIICQCCQKPFATFKLNTSSFIIFKVDSCAVFHFFLETKRISLKYYNKIFRKLWISKDIFKTGNIHIFI